MTPALEEAGLSDDVDFALEVYGLNRGGNFRDPHHPGEPARNVLFLAERPDMLAKNLGMPQDEFDDKNLVPEGIEGRVPSKGPLSALVRQLLGARQLARGPISLQTRLGPPRSGNLYALFSQFELCACGRIVEAHDQIPGLDAIPLAMSDLCDPTAHLGGHARTPARANRAGLRVADRR